jgi:hypothetical protein
MKQVLSSIKRIIEWIPILWKDRDWDYIFILRLLHYKLERTRDCIVSNNFISDANKVAQEINDSLTKLDKILNNEADDEWYKHYTESHPEGRHSDPCVICKYLLDLTEIKENMLWYDFWTDLRLNIRGWWD